VFLTTVASAVADASSHKLVLVAGGVLLTVAAVLLLVNRCGGILGCDAQALPRGPVTFEQVKSHPEGHLFYPGAHVYWPIGGGEERNLIEGGANPAFAGAILTSHDSADAIVGWYQNWLLSHGWAVDDRAIGSTVWVSYVGFTRGSREQFTVAIDDPKLLSGVLGTAVPSDRGTVFEVRYQIRPGS
jgi:hypothetical protein